MTSREEQLDRYIDALNAGEYPVAGVDEPDLADLLDVARRVASLRETEWPDSNFPDRLADDLAAHLRPPLPQVTSMVSDGGTSTTLNGHAATAAGNLDKRRLVRPQHRWLREGSQMAAAALVVVLLTGVLAAVLSNRADELRQFAHQPTATSSAEETGQATPKPASTTVNPGPSSPVTSQELIDLQSRAGFQLYVPEWLQEGHEIQIPPGPEWLSANTSQVILGVKDGSGAWDLTIYQSYPFRAGPETMPSYMYPATEEHLSNGLTVHVYEYLGRIGLWWQVGDTFIRIDAENHRSPSREDGRPAPREEMFKIARSMVPVALSTKPIPLPPDAKLRSPQAAVAAAKELATRIGSEQNVSPQLISVQLMTVQDVLVDMADSGTWVNLGNPDTPIWRVELDGVEILHPCRIESTSPCIHTRAAIVLHAVTGEVLGTQGLNPADALPTPTVNPTASPKIPAPDGQMITLDEAKERVRAFLGESHAELDAHLSPVPAGMSENLSTIVITRRLKGSLIPDRFLIDADTGEILEASIPNNIPGNPATDQLADPLSEAAAMRIAEEFARAHFAGFDQLALYEARQPGPDETGVVHRVYVVQWQQQDPGSGVWLPTYVSVAVHLDTGLVYQYISQRLDYDGPTAPTVSQEQAVAVALAEAGKHSGLGPVTVVRVELHAQASYAKTADQLMWSVVLEGGGPETGRVTIFVDAVSGRITSRRMTW